MRAETAYNVIQALPEAEMARLYSMLRQSEKIIDVKPKKQDDEFWTVTEASDYIQKIFSENAMRRAGQNKKKPEAVTSGSKHTYNPFKSNKR